MPRDTPKLGDTVARDTPPHTVTEGIIPTQLKVVRPQIPGTAGYNLMGFEVQVRQLWPERPLGRVEPSLRGVLRPAIEDQPIR